MISSDRILRSLPFLVATVATFLATVLTRAPDFLAYKIHHITELECKSARNRVKFKQLFLVLFFDKNLIFFIVKEDGSSQGEVRSKIKKAMQIDYSFL